MKLPVMTAAAMAYFHVGAGALPWAPPPASVEQRAWLGATSGSQKFDWDRSGQFADFADPQRRLKNALEKFTQFPMGWNGDAGLPLGSAAYADAISFLSKLPRPASCSAELALCPDGDVSFVWKAASFYAEANIVGDGSVALYAESDGNILMLSEVQNVTLPLQLRQILETYIV